MKRRITIAAIALAGVLTIAGCAQNSDQATVTNLALKDAKSHLLPGQSATTEGAWTWGNGYAVLTKTDGKNDKGPYTNWEAYGYQQSGGSWKLVKSDLVDGETYTLGPGDYCWSSVEGMHALTNRSDAPVRWLETQAPQPPSRHQFRYRADWERIVAGAG